MNNIEHVFYWTIAFSLRLDVPKMMGRPYYVVNSFRAVGITSGFVLIVIILILQVIVYHDSKQETREGILLYPRRRVYPMTLKQETILIQVFLQRRA